MEAAEGCGLLITTPAGTRGPNIPECLYTQRVWFGFSAVGEEFNIEEGCIIESIIISPCGFPMCGRCSAEWPSCGRSSSTSSWSCPWIWTRTRRCSRVTLSPAMTISGGSFRSTGTTLQMPGAPLLPQDMSQEEKDELYQTLEKIRELELLSPPFERSVLQGWDDRLMGLGKMPP